MSISNVRALNCLLIFSWGEKRMKLFVLSSVFIATIIICLYANIVIIYNKKKMKDRLRRIVKNRPTRQKNFINVDSESVTNQEPKKKYLKEKILEFFDRVLAERNFRAKLVLELRKADIPLQPSEFMFLVVLFIACLIFIGILLTENLIIRGILLMFGVWFPCFYLNLKQKVQLKEFNNQLPDALNLISSALKSGFSLLQAFDVVSKELPPPISREFNQVLKECRLNVSIEDALNNMLKRVNSPDLDLVVTAVLIQRQTGGNLSEILDNINETIRNRIKLKGEIRTLTAQGRISGIIISLLPIGLGLIIYLIKPGYISLLITHPVGWLLLSGALVMELVGIILIRKIVSINY